jgi:uncharacterized membrane protein
MWAFATLQKERQTAKRPAKLKLDVMFAVVVVVLIVVVLIVVCVLLESFLLVWRCRRKD